MLNILRQHTVPESQHKHRAVVICWTLARKISPPVYPWWEEGMEEYFWRYLYQPWAGNTQHSININIAYSLITSGLKCLQNVSSSASSTISVWNNAGYMPLSLHFLKEYQEYTKHQLNSTEDKVIFKCNHKQHYLTLFLQTLIILKTIAYNHLCYRARVFLKQKSRLLTANLG